MAVAKHNEVKTMRIFSSWDYKHQAICMWNYEKQKKITRKTKETKKRPLIIKSFDNES